MSFSTRVKEELVLINGSSKERWAELSALLRAGGYLEITAKGLALSLETDKAMITRRVFSLIKAEQNLMMQVRVNKNTGFRGVNKYKLTMLPQKGLLPFLKDLGILNEEYLPVANVPKALLGSEESCRAYLRGLFLCRGSINNPAKSYYLEIIFDREVLALETVQLMTSMGLKALFRKRRQFWLVYINMVEQIINFLSMIGAHKALLDIESLRTFKEVRSNINRKLNWETANLDKTVHASLQQLENIQIIAHNIGLANLPKSLREIALLRIENPYSTLKELGTKMQPPLSKSGVNHRMRRLNKMGQNIKNDNMPDT